MVQSFPVSLRLSLRLKTMCVENSASSSHSSMCHGNEPGPHRSEHRLVHGQIRRRSRVRVPGSWEGALGCIMQEALPACARKAWRVCLIASRCLSCSPFSLPGPTH